MNGDVIPPNADNNVHESNAKYTSADSSTVSNDTKENKSRIKTYFIGGTVFATALGFTFFFLLEVCII
jgi:hypothetical protein